MLIVPGIFHFRQKCVIAGILTVFAFSACVHSVSIEDNEFINEIDSLNKQLSKTRLSSEDELQVILNQHRISDSVGYKKGLVESGILLYQYYIDKGDLQQAFNYLEKNESTIEDLDEEVLAGRVYFYLGQFQELISNFDVAITYLLKSAEKFSSANDKGRAAKAYRQIGNIAHDNQDWLLARKYRWLAYSTHREVNDTIEVIKDMTNLSLFYNKIGKKDSADFFMEKALNANEFLNNPRDQAQFLVNIATSTIDSGNYLNAESLLNRALVLLDSTKHPKDYIFVAPYIFANLGLIKNANEDFGKASYFFKKSLMMAGPNVPLATRASLNYQLCQTLNKMKQHEEASYYLSQYVILLDSSNLELNKQNLLALEMKFNFEQAEKDRLEKQRRLNIILISTGVVVGLVLLIMALLYSRQRIKIKNANLQKRIQDINIERLNRELTIHALNVVRSNEKKVSLLNLIKNQLPNFKKENQILLHKVIAGFEDDQKDAGWKEFEIRFTEVHSGFYEKLLKINPNLTLNERRLCAFLLLNMSSKEISAITGQSVNAIEQARIRLRRQLGITNQSITLTSFLSSL